MRSPKQRLQDILECSQRIESFVASTSSFDDFAANTLLQSAVLYQLTIIGEAVHCLPSNLTINDSQMDWAAIEAMRNLIVHAYHRVDLLLVWRTVKQEVPALRKLVQGMLASLNDDSAHQS
jgi:uncharacterized protein with HEPN domain